MKWKSLTSTQNLKLAWRRINTGRNLQYKRFFRPAYLIYESAVDEHLRDLHKALVARVWQPSHATRIYLPKPSGLQRPLSLLAIEDQIVLQAIANQFATRLHKKRRLVELQSVFSNKLASPKDSIFFMERWQTTYGAFQKRCTQVFNQGQKWSAEFDLSAYYDTISHDLMLSATFGDKADAATMDSIKEWLRVWSADNIAAMTGHGIPQGPIASDFLAEAFFLPIDLQLQNSDFEYLRYVDDIRLFGRSENEVREAAILLEQECRHRGLIPQSTKFVVRELKSPEEAMGALPSIVPSDGKGAFEPAMGATAARKLLETAIDGRPQRVSDKARFRYVMYRAPKDVDILRAVLRLLPRHPEHIDAFIAYFSNYAKSTRIARAALEYLESGVPYSYVRGELWHLVARLAGEGEIERALPLARKDAKGRSRCIVLSWGVMHFLMRCQKEGRSRDRRRFGSEHSISRSLLAPILPDREFSRGGHGASLLKGTLIEQLAGARELQKRNIALGALGLRQRDLPHSCASTLKALGVIRRAHRRIARDWVGETLNSLYGCRRNSIWRELLGAEYEHALQFLIEAKARFPGAYSEWLGLQDSFLDIAIRQFFVFLVQKGLQGHSKTSDKNGRLVKYGSLISQGGPFDRHYPAIAADLRDVHQRRNRLPGSHPYDEKGGVKNVWLTRAQRDALVPKVRGALDGLVIVVQQSQ